MEAESSRGVVESRPVWLGRMLTAAQFDLSSRSVWRPNPREGSSNRGLCGRGGLFRQRFLTLVPGQYGGRILQRGRRIEASFLVRNARSALFGLSSRSVWRPNPREGSSNRGRSELAGESTQHFFTLVRGQYGGRALKRGRRIEACVAVPEFGGSTFSP